MAIILVHTNDLAESAKQVLEEEGYRVVEMSNPDMCVIREDSPESPHALDLAALGSGFAWLGFWLALGGICAAALLAS